MIDAKTKGVNGQKLKRNDKAEKVRLEGRWWHFRKRSCTRLKTQIAMTESCRYTKVCG